MHANAHHEAQSDDFKLGEWNGDETLMSSPAAQKDVCVTFTGFLGMKIGRVFKTFDSFYAQNSKIVTGIRYGSPITPFTTAPNTCKGADGNKSRP